MNIREWTLPFYTILMQLATGVLLSLWIMRSFYQKRIGLGMMDRIVQYPIIVILITISSGMIGSHFHLGRPLISIFSMLNFQTSWISREITFTVFYFFFTCLLCVMVWSHHSPAKLKTVVGWVAIGCGLSTVYCMSRIYMIPIHPAWNTPITIISFYGAAFLLGVMSLTLIMYLELKFAEVRGLTDVEIRYRILRESFPWFTIAVVVFSSVILGSNYYLLSYLRTGNEIAHISYQLLSGLYRPLLLMRVLSTILGILVLIGIFYVIVRKNRSLHTIFFPLYLSGSLLLLGEIIGRILFYAMDVRLGS